MRNWPLKVTLLVAIVGLFYGINGMIAPELYRAMKPPALGYIFVPDDDAFTGFRQRIEIQFVQFGPMGDSPLSATAHVTRNPDDPLQDLPLEPLLYQGKPTDTWFAVLPPLEEKGARWFYYVTIQTAKGQTIELYKKMNWFEKLFSGFTKDKQLFWVTYEGNVIREMPYGRFLLVTHILLSFGALLYLFHTLYYILRLIMNPTDADFVKGYKSAFWATLSFTVGAIIIGIPIVQYTFGVGFAPWPTRGLFNLGDITDTKSLLLSVWWIILLIGSFKDFRASVNGLGIGKRQRLFGFLTVLALVITVLAFMIPHSQFLQSSH